eukprot:363766-Chlamydomonas_euryale.AAC.9
MFTQAPHLALNPKAPHPTPPHPTPDAHVDPNRLQYPQPSARVPSLPPTPTALCTCFQSAPHAPSPTHVLPVALVRARFQPRQTPQLVGAVVRIERQVVQLPRLCCAVPTCTSAKAAAAVSCGVAASTVASLAAAAAYDAPAKPLAATAAVPPHDSLDVAVQRHVAELARRLAGQVCGVRQAQRKRLLAVRRLCLQQRALRHSAHTQQASRAGGQADVGAAAAAAAATADAPATADVAAAVAAAAAAATADASATAYAAAATAAAAAATAAAAHSKTAPGPAASAAWMVCTLRWRREPQLSSLQEPFHGARQVCLVWVQVQQRRVAGHLRWAGLLSAGLAV